MKLERKTAAPMEEVILEFLKRSGIGTKHNVALVFKAWDEVSGAGKYTQRRFFRDGKLYVTLSSSVVRNSLYMQRGSIVSGINERLLADPLFVRDNVLAGTVKEIVLK